VPYLSSEPEGSVKQSITGVTMSWKLSELTIKSITGYETTKDTFTSSFSGDNAVVTGGFVGGEQMDVTQFTEEVQLLGKAFNDRLDYLAGAYYLHESGSQQFGWYGLSFLGLGPISTSNIDAKTQSYSIFGQGNFKITDALTATAGVRWTEDKKTDDLSIVQFGLTPVFFPGFNTPLHYDLTFVSVTPKFGLDYKLATGGSVDSAMLYLSAGKGFKSGGVSGINIFNLAGSQVPYKPEENWTYEAGLKSEFFDHKLRVNAAFFVAKVTNLVLNETVQLAPGAFAFPEVNAGDTKVEGLELEISAVPFTGLTLFLNPAFDHGEYTTLAPGASALLAKLSHTVDSNGFSVANPIPPQLPWFSFTSGFDYTHPMAIGTNAGSQFLLGMDWFKTASYPIAASNDFVVSAYDRLNGYVGVALNDKLQFRLVGKNLQNRVTVSTGSRGLGGFLVLPPREYLLTFAYKLGH
jgi:iron complex outermembrane receptor protein